MTSVASVVVVVTVLASGVARTQDPGVVRLSERTERTLPTLEHAQSMFYSGRYDDASAITSTLCAADDLEACELRTSSLHFQIRRAMGESADRNRAWTMCAACPDLLSAFVAETDRARSLARARVQSNVRWVRLTGHAPRYHVRGGRFLLVPTIRVNGPARSAVK
ncbi:MAG TPA: hypothetical protein VFB99_05855 [Vicinamibacterales bacterium]|nr:hypothetical protein [Vicinamibacterales bacterium]